MGMWDGLASPVTAPETTQVVDSRETQQPQLNKAQQLRADNAEFRGEDAGAMAAFGEGLANAIPAGQKITSAIGAGIATVGGAGKYSDLYKQAMANTEETARQNPKASIAGSLAGMGMGLPIGMAGAKLAGGAISAIPKGAAALGRLSGLGKTAKDAGMLAKTGGLAIRSAKSAAMAAPVGALYGAADAPDGQYGAGAMAGASTAAKIGAALPVAGAVLSPVADMVGGAVRSGMGKLAVSKLRKESKLAGSIAPPDSNVAIGKVIKQLRADYPDPASFNAAMDNYIKTKDVGLAEIAGKNTKKLAEASAQYPSGNVAGESYIESRVEGAKGRIAKTFSDHVNSNKDFYGTLDDVVENGRKRAAPLYDGAFNATENQAISSPAIDNILKTPSGKQALASARVNMQNDMAKMGIPEEELGSMAKEAEKMGLMETTEGGVQGGLNLRSLDYVKKSLDLQYRNARKGFDAQTSTVDPRSIQNLTEDLRNELDNLDTTGMYKKARDVSGDYLSNSKAMDDGKNFANLGAPEEIKKYFSTLGETQKESFKAGLVRKVKDDMDSAVDNANLYKRVFGNQTKRDKIAAVLNEKEYNDLSKNMKAEENLFKFKDQILGNSKTASRQLMAREFDSEGMQVLQDIGSSGITGAAAKKAVRVINTMFDGLSDKSAGKVAEILYETDPAKKLAILKTMQAASGKTKAESMEAIKAYFALDAGIKKAKDYIKNESGSVGGISDIIDNQTDSFINKLKSIGIDDVSVKKSVNREGGFSNYVEIVTPAGQTRKIRISDHYNNANFNDQANNIVGRSDESISGQFDRHVENILSAEKKANEKILMVKNLSENNDFMSDFAKLENQKKRLSDSKYRERIKVIEEKYNVNLGSKKAMDIVKDKLSKLDFSNPKTQLGVAGAAGGGALLTNQGQ